MGQINIQATKLDLLCWLLFINILSGDSFDREFCDLFFWELHKFGEATSISHELNSINDKSSPQKVLFGKSRKNQMNFLVQFSTCRRHMIFSLKSITFIWVASFAESDLNLYLMKHRKFEENFQVFRKLRSCVAEFRKLNQLTFFLMNFMKIICSAFSNRISFSIRLSMAIELFCRQKSLDIFRNRKDKNKMKILKMMAICELSENVPKWKLFPSIDEFDIELIFFRTSWKSSCDDKEINLILWYLQQFSNRECAELQSPKQTLPN